MEISALYKCFTECGCVTTDTRNCPEGSMFFALKGASFNGNAFALQALEKGCRYAVVDEAIYAEAGNPNIILVDNCLNTLQQLAAYHRRVLGTRMIGITGTNGKTTTKELIATVLKQKFNVLYTQGNLNNHIGVPLTLLKLTPEHDIAVVEMGANHPGEIEILTNIAQPDYGIITNVGKAHLEGFGSFEGVIRTKGELYDYIRNKGGIVFIQNENPYLNGILNGLQCVRYGESEGIFVTGHLVSCSPFLTFAWKSSADNMINAESTVIACNPVNEVMSESGQNQKYDSYHSVSTHIIGSYNLDNALAAVAIGKYFGVDDNDICSALSAYIPQNNRSQLVETNSNKLVVDAYNANPTSMSAAIMNFRLIDAPHKMVILGDMKELGESSIEEHIRILKMLIESHFDRVILVGPEFCAAQKNFIINESQFTLSGNHIDSDISESSITSETSEILEVSERPDKSVNLGNALLDNTLCKCNVSTFEHYEDVHRLGDVLSHNKPLGYTILIKGSNSMKLSILSEIL